MKLLNVDGISANHLADLNFSKTNIRLYVFNAQKSQ